MEVEPIQLDFDEYQHVDDVGKRIEVAIGEFDAKNDQLRQNIIGEAKTGFFNSKTPIVSTEPVTSIFRDAIEKGFEEAGFVIVDRQSADYIVSGTIESFWVDEYATGFSLEYSKAYVRYDMFVKTPEGEIVWANTQEQYETSDNSLEATAHNIQTLRQALENSIETIFADNRFWSAFEDVE